MTHPIRSCADCGTDISARHGNAKRCPACAKAEAQRIQRDREQHRAPRSTRPTRRNEPLIEQQCEVCTVAFTSPRPRFACSKRCDEYARRHPGFRDTARACEMCGHDLPAGTHRTARFCGEACRSAAGKRRNRIIVRPYERRTDCLHCGGPLGKTKAGSKYCSRQCEARESRYPGSYERRRSRVCEHCGTPLAATERIDRRHCSDRCTVLANQLVRRARRRGLPVERINRVEIFERDSWVCHICHQPVDPDLRNDPMSANLDHIIPYAEPGSPGHVWQNLALAHRRCNIGKNSRVRPEDWVLYEELRARRTAWLAAKQLIPRTPRD